MSTKITHIKFANAVKIQGEELFLEESKGYKIDLMNGMVVRVENLKTNQITFTTLMNVIYWKGEEIQSKQKPAQEPVETEDKPVKRKKAA